VNVISNDYDPEGQALTLVAVSDADPERGSASVASASSVRFDSGRLTGGEALTYTVRDGLGATATGILNVTVSGGTCPIGPLEAPPAAPLAAPPAEPPPAEQPAAEPETVR
jgi:hypothetical protein